MYTVLYGVMYYVYKQIFKQMRDIILQVYVSSQLQMKDIHYTM